MSGTYDSGSNVMVAVNSSGGPNTGNGTIDMVSQTGTTPLVGVVTVSITGVTGGFASYSVANTNLSGPQSVMGMLSTTPGMSVTVTLPGISFRITSGTAAFVMNDGFSVFLSALGPNIAYNATQQTGIGINVQQFQAVPGSAQQNWRATIQAMFDYCSANPGVTGIIPPGVYQCDDPDSAMNYRLTVNSGLTVIAYGAIIGTSMTNTNGDNGFICVGNTAMTYPVSVVGVTIIGGTWGAIGPGGVTQTSNSAIFKGTRTGRIFSLYANWLTLIDVTVRGYKGGNAFSLVGDNMLLRNVAFWNSDENTGAGGVRLNIGVNFQAYNTQGRSGDDCLQFAPGHGSMTASVANAFFIGGSVHSVNARAIIATLIDQGGTGGLASSISNVGWVGIVGVSDGGPSHSGSAAVCYISNEDSSASISDVTVADCNLTANGTLAGTYPCWIHAGAPSYNTGGVTGVNFSNLVLNNCNQTAIYLDGFATQAGGVNYTSCSNINFRDFTIHMAGGALVPCVTVRQCLGYSFVNGVMTENFSATTPSNAMVLGDSSGSLHLKASYGRIEGCSLFTSDAMSTNQTPLILVQNGDMNAIQGWCKFFVGPSPVIPTSSASAQAAVQIAANATNTFVDCVDFRGVNTTTPILNSGVGTRLGLNIINGSSAAPSPDAALTLSKTSSNAASGSYTWPQGSVVLELTATGTIAALTIVLPTASNDGEVRILSAPSGMFTALTLSGATVKNYTSPFAFAMGAALRLVWDSSGTGYWFAA